MTRKKLEISIHKIIPIFVEYNIQALKERMSRILHDITAVISDTHTDLSIQYAIFIAHMPDLPVIVRSMRYVLVTLMLPCKSQVKQMLYERNVDLTFQKVDACANLCCLGEDVGLCILLWVCGWFEFHGFRHVK